MEKPLLLHHTKQQKLKDMTQVFDWTKQTKGSSVYQMTGVTFDPTTQYGSTERKQSTKRFCVVVRAGSMWKAIQTVNSHLEGLHFSQGTIMRIKPKEWTLEKLDEFAKFCNDYTNL